MTIKEQLFEMQDIKYRSFLCGLIPTVDPDTVIGVRVPQLRKLAAELAKNNCVEAFLKDLPHSCYEENVIHGILISRERDFEACLALVNEFLPYIDNWAVCDMLSPKVLVKKPEKLLEEIERWMKSEKIYTVRFAIGRLMANFLDELFSPEYPKAVAAVISDEYYINMMRAWYFATALAKQYDAVLPYFTEYRLDRWTHNKSIRKACESFRILPVQKEELKKLKLK